ncbi:MAG: glycosyltransferase family 2 protein [Propionibacteriaceae bacterium]|nr:glycosyltransferase family 2 protein [Propionibacteriaceae bacterium]
MPPLISAIIPVYNTEDYLSATIESILRQDIGFGKHVELILVNDGSTDGSRTVCERYQKQWPDNVILLDQSNSGPASAMNSGLRNAQGEYVHFMGSDDLLSRSFYRSAIRFFAKVENEVDLVSCKVTFFENSIDQHYLNWKYSKTRVINLDLEPEASLYHLPTCLVRREVLANKAFDERLVISEDVHLLMRILLEKKAYGVLSGPVYHYRKRKARGSLIDTKLHNPQYFQVPSLVYGDILKNWTDKTGNIHPFAQHEIMNDARWKLTGEKQQTVLSTQEESNYRDEVLRICCLMDDDVIIRQRGLSLDQKVFLLKRKHGDDEFEESIRYANGSCYFNETKLIDFSQRGYAPSVFINFVHALGDGRLRIEGVFNSDIISSSDQRFFEVATEKYDIKHIPWVNVQDQFFGIPYCGPKGFEAVIEVANRDHIKCILEVKGGERIDMPIVFQKTAGLSSLNHHYIEKGDLILLNNRGRFEVCTAEQGEQAQLEKRFQRSILRDWQLKHLFRPIKLTLRGNWRMLPKKKLARTMISPVIRLLKTGMANISDVKTRRAYFRDCMEHAGQLWLISDHCEKVGGPGEELFQFMQKDHSTQYDFYYVRCENSPDFGDLPGARHVLDFSSGRHKSLFLQADILISSQHKSFVQHPFGSRWNHFCDLFPQGFVYLQPEDSCEDMSGELNRLKNNIGLFVTQSESSRRSILDFDYHYSEENVIIWEDPDQVAKAIIEYGATRNGSID